MKKIAFILVLAMAASAFAASYKNNTYQKLANEYTKKAEAALDAGEYALSEVKKALNMGLHCCVFSNNVPLREEREMKQTCCSTDYTSHTSGRV